MTDPRIETIRQWYRSTHDGKECSFVAIGFLLDDLAALTSALPPAQEVSTLDARLVTPLVELRQHLERCVEFAEVSGKVVTLSLDRARAIVETLRSRPPVKQELEVTDECARTLVELHACASSWEQGVRLLGNTTAAAITGTTFALLTLLPREQLRAAQATAHQGQEPSPAGDSAEVVERVKAALRKVDEEPALLSTADPDDDVYYERSARAAIRAAGTHPPEALAMAQQNRFRVEGIVGSVPENLHRLMLKDARALVLLLERETAGGR